MCTPVAEPDNVVVTLPQLCQPPVLLTGTLAMIGPVVESKRYWIGAGSGRTGGASGGYRRGGRRTEVHIE